MKSYHLESTFYILKFLLVVLIFKLCLKYKFKTIFKWIKRKIDNSDFRARKHKKFIKFKVLKLCMFWSYKNTFLLFYVLEH